MDKNIVEKSNILNCFENCQPAENMSLNEMRFFCMYLSKLNAREPAKRTIEIPIQEFENLFGVTVNTTEFTERLYSILRRVMFIKKDNKNKMINLYSEFEWASDECYSILKVTCNYDIVPYLFELKNNYTAYRISNISKLNSVTKIRLYELMKQYENLKSIEIEIEILKHMIGSNISTFKLFHQQVIKPAIKDINEYTDIKVTYEKILKCRKVTAIKFHIFGNTSEEIQVLPEVTEIVEIEQVPKQHKSKSLQDLYNQYFSSEKLEIFENTIKLSLDEYSKTEIETASKSILIDSINNFIEQKSKRKIKSEYNYMNSIIIKSIDNYKEKHKPKKEQSYDIEKFEDFAINGDELKKVYDEIFKNIMNAGFITADYETAFKILKYNKEYKNLPKDKLEFIESQMESKKQAAEMLSNVL